MLAVLGPPGRLPGLPVELDGRGDERKRVATADVDRGDVAVGQHLRVAVQLGAASVPAPIRPSMSASTEPPFGQRPPGEHRLEILATHERALARLDSMSTYRGSVAISG